MFNTLTHGLWIYKLGYYLRSLKCKLNGKQTCVLHSYTYTHIQAHTHTQPCLDSQLHAQLLHTTHSLAATALAATWIYCVTVLLCSHRHWVQTSLWCVPHQQILGFKQRASDGCPGNRCLSWCTWCVGYMHVCAQHVHVTCVQHVCGDVEMNCIHVHDSCTHT